MSPHLRCMFRIVLFSRSAPPRLVNPYLHYPKRTEGINVTIYFNYLLEGEKP